MGLRWIRHLLAARSAGAASEGTRPCGARRFGDVPPPPASGPRETWSEAQSRWIDDNGASRPKAARQVLSALASCDPCGRFRARAEGGGWIVTGPAGSITLADATAEIHFVALLSTYAYTDGP